MKEQECSQKPSIKAYINASHLFHTCFVALALIVVYFFPQQMKMQSEAKQINVPKPCHHNTDDLFDKPHFQFSLNEYAIDYFTELTH